MSFTIFQNEKKPFQGPSKKKKFKTSKSWHFSKRINPWFYSKNSHFCKFFFQAILNRKMSLRILQNGKTPFEAIKTRSSRSHKSDIFSKGVNPYFWSKNGYFSSFFFLGNIGQKNVFYDILERKKAFLGYKKEKFKTLKNCHFSKEITHGFAPKIAIFASFFFRQFQPGNCLLQYSRTKKSLSRL